MTGPEAYSYADVADLLAEITGKQIVYPQPDVATYREALRQGGAPDSVADYMIPVYGLLRDHAVTEPTDAVATLTGSRPEPLLVSCQPVAFLPIDMRNRKCLYTTSVFYLGIGTLAGHPGQSLLFLSVWKGSDQSGGKPNHLVGIHRTEMALTKIHAAKVSDRLAGPPFQDISAGAVTCQPDLSASRLAVRQPALPLK